MTELSAGLPGQSDRRRLGLIGGMSWESTALYYRLLNEGVRERLGGHHSLELVLHSVNFADIVAQQQAGDWAGAGAVLADAARGLTAAGAELIMICANTMHKVADAVEAATEVPLLHVADVVAERLRQQGVGTVGLVATRYTMEDDFYRDRLASHKITTVVPCADDRDLVHKIIYGELVHGVFTAGSRGALVEVIERMRPAGIGAVILGCTEIELLLSADDVDLPLLPTTALHCSAALDQVLTPVDFEE